ncbi:MAG TPA: creatininase family protein [Acidobacteriota bacterium]|nr:creatininase family protein [Acidobacteriota bacterium]
MKPRQTGSSLDSLLVLERLEVGRVRLEKRRLKAAYIVTLPRGESSSFDFEYAFQEDVFNPASSADQNLAALMAAQVALNYGLFCRRLTFHGPFDEADRRFLAAMAENTAREIYVKKILQPNPFLQGLDLPFPVQRRDSYLQAEMEFADPLPARDAWDRHPWKGRKQRVGILSSGGKDSLLSHGLLEEAGYEIHPVFVNESGRHWFTALNAYRHFEQEVPNTSRVWTNSDRLFNWMLRRLSFIRPDFNRLRADIYPVRLWTVAVFLAGALPLLRKRGVGRLVIGSEFDTTVRTRHQGITHYDGLYDQSRYFDNAMSRFYRRKGWVLSQFSVLRPLSELLIEKILAERYPRYLRLQLSCHAAHKEKGGSEETEPKGRVLPCGRCEKCRRIVSMLVALGQDPAALGYTVQQQEECLSAFAQKGSHQESAAAHQVAHMLVEGKVIAADSPLGCKAKPHPESLKLRFDREHSPLDGLPEDLRRKLWPLMLEHARGSVRRTGRLWLDFDPLDDESMARRFPFESNDAQDEKDSLSYLLGELTWPEAERRLAEVDLALLPVGAIEQHGHHLPLDTDAFDADYLARRVAEACTHPKPLVLPLIPYGVSYHHDDFKGTISVSNEALSRMVYEIGMSVARNGITKLIIINGHGGNDATLKFAAQMINRDAHIFTCVDTGETSDHDIGLLAETDEDVHAGEIETSTTLAVRPDLVKMDQAKGFVPSFSSRYLDFSSKRSVEWYARTAKISPSGVLGDPSKASAEKGVRMWDVMVKNLVELVEDLKDLSLEEIYERRY